MKRIITLLLSVFLLNSSVAQDTNSQNKDKENETKDQKFIYSNNICLITKKEQDEAKEYILSSRDNQNATIKLALTILQLRLINNSKFSDVNCSLRYFIERYNEKYKNWGSSDESVSGIVSEYLRILEKLRTDPKTQAEYEKTVLNSGEINFYYSVLGKNTGDYNILEPNLARKFFIANLTSKSNQRGVNAEEWQLLFDLFYSKNIPLPKELSDFLRAHLSKQTYSNSQLMNVYLSNVNDFSYNDFFKAIFENLPSNKVSMYMDGGGVNPAQAKSIFLSKYLPDDFKCNYAKENVAKNAPKLAKEAVEELKKLNVKCLNDALADASKFLYPAGGCPQIQFDKGEDHSRLITNMSGEFSRNWIDCRKKCSHGDKCTAIQDVSGLYSFMNNKFENDIGLYKEMQSKNSNNNFGMAALPLKYDYKPVGICNEKGICGEKIVSCVDSDVIKKVTEELKNAKYQSCKIDTDCYIYATGDGSCSEYAINVNLLPQMPGMPQPINQNVRVFHSGMTNFLTSRLQKIAEDCGKPFASWGCQQKSTTTSKCENNVCILVK
ncbi:MAG: hypothetical protein WC635_12270 [Bacteriovorax sp.]|jgi:hypothetical protein